MIVVQINYEFQFVSTRDPPQRVGLEHSLFLYGTVQAAKRYEKYPAKLSFQDGSDGTSPVSKQVYLRCHGAPTQQFPVDEVKGNRMGKSANIISLNSDFTLKSSLFSSKTDP